MVEALGEIAEVFEDRLTMLPAMVSKDYMFAEATLTLKDINDNESIVVLSADRLYANLSGAVASTEAA